MATFDTAGLATLLQQLGTLAAPDPTPLLQEWEDIIREDNRRGVLAGLDAHGDLMPPVTYRPVAPARRVTAQQRNGTRGVFAGFGPHASGLNNNLTPAEYKRLAGPPLAPRGASSRVITNLVTTHTTAPVDGLWFAAGFWDEVVSTKGTPFLAAHFTGAATGRNHRTKLPKRDLRGIRPWGIGQALAALQRWGAVLLSKVG